jgi:O-antigen/teichoic acid export membrane protein
MLILGAKEEESGSTRYYSAVAVQQGAICVATALLVWAGISMAGVLSEPAVGRLAVPLALATVTFQAHNFFRRYFFARRRAIVALAGDALRIGLQFAALLLLPIMCTGCGSETGIWILVSACAASSMLGIALFGRFEWDAFTFGKMVQRHWTLSKWLLPSAVMFWMSTQAFVVASGMVLGAAATGALKAAMSLVGVMNILLQALDSFAPTQAAGALHRGGAQELIGYICRLAAMVILLMAGLVTILNSDTDALVRLVYGNGYEGLVSMVRWLCASSFLYGMAVLLGIWVTAIENTRIIFNSYLMATIFAISAGYPMTRFFGMEGVLVGSLVVETIKVIALLVPLAQWAKTAQRTVRSRVSY